MKESLLSVIDVSKKYDTNGTALDLIRVDVRSAERLAIVGETGSGKSTLLKIIAGLLQPDNGSVMIEGEKLEGPNDKLIPGYEDIAYLSQHFELPKFISVFQHLDDEYLISSEEAKEVYLACQIGHLLDRDTSALSGGEKQRVALAKLLLRKPKLLLLDEPFSNLDSINKRAIKQVMEDVESELSTTIILVAHDPRDVLSWASRVMVFRKGGLVQEDDSKTIYERPINNYVAGLFGSYNLLTASDWDLNTSDSNLIDGQILVRPEQLTPSENKGVEGRVTDIKYYGERDEVTIQTQNDLVIIHATVGKHERGQKIRLTLT